MTAQRHRLSRAADALRDVRVRDAMTRPIVTCTPDVPLREVAELMVNHRIHSVVVLAPPLDEDVPAHRRWGVLSDLDLAAAAPWEAEVATAGSVAASPAALVRPDDRLAAAAQLMAEYSTAHLLVVEEGVDEPVGIVSALDVARALAPPPAEDEVTLAPSVRARPGDLLRIMPHRQGAPAREAEVLEARGPGGGPPFLVRWEDTGRVTLLYPGSDAAIEHLGAAGD